ncbi:ShlB/FhaC/HecB family hemolysin secretion/activation protein [Bisgaard Taxon 45]
MGKYQSKQFEQLLLRCSAVFLLCQSTLAYSQEINPLTQELLHLKNKQQFEHANENLKKAQQFLEDPQSNPEKTYSFPDTVTTSKHKITSISIDLAGENVSLNFDNVIKAYQNQPLSTKIVFQLVKDLTEVLYRAGYVTSAIGLKNGKISHGDLEFIVLWGRTHSVLVAGEKPTGFRDKAMVSVLPQLNGKRLNIYDIDQLIEILNTTNKKATVNVVASEMQGASNLNIDRQYDAFPQVSIGFNNSGAGNNANGRNQATLNIAWSDLLGTNDRWNFSSSYRLYKNHHANQQRNYALSYSQPIGFSTVEIKASESAYEKELRGINTHSSHGKTQILAVKLMHVLLRNKETILSAYTDFEFKKRLSYFSDILTGKYHNNKVSVGLSYITNLAYGKLYADIAYANGLRWFGANYSAYDTNREKTLKLLSGSVNWQRPISIFERAMNYQLRIGAQYGFDSLYSENQFSIGDEYTVRGFKGGALSGDSGVYLSQTLSIPFYPQHAYLSHVSPFIGFDMGKVHIKSSHKTDTLVGFALGLKTQIKLLSLSLTYSQPMNGVGGVDQHRQKPIYYFTGSLSF